LLDRARLVEYAWSIPDSRSCVHLAAFRAGSTVKVPEAGDEPAVHANRDQVENAGAVVLVLSRAKWEEGEGKVWDWYLGLVVLVAWFGATVRDGVHQGSSVSLVHSKM
jgi:hypothetical protein